MSEKPQNTGRKNDFWDQLLADPEFMEGVKKHADLAAQRDERLQLLERAFEEQQRKIAGLLHPVRKSHDLRGELVRDPSRAAALAQRHERLNIASDVVMTALAEDREAWRSMYAKIDRYGGFFEHYDEDFVRDRIEDPAGPEKGGWIVAASYGKPRPQDAEIEGGDIQLWVPPDDAKSLPESIALTEKDFVNKDTQRILDFLRQYPMRTAWTSDVCSERGQGFETHGFASTATSTAFSRIADLNRGREHPVDFTLAAIAEVTGVLGENGEELRSIDPPWPNTQSLILHRRVRKTAVGVNLASWELGKQLDRRVPVTLPDGRSFFIRMNWSIVCQELSPTAQGVSVTSVPVQSRMSSVPTNSPDQPTS